MGPTGLALYIEIRCRCCHEPRPPLVSTPVVLSQIRYPHPRAAVGRYLSHISYLISCMYIAVGCRNSYCRGIMLCRQDNFPHSTNRHWNFKSVKALTVLHHSHVNSQERSLLSRLSGRFPALTELRLGMGIYRLELSILVLLFSQIPSGVKYLGLFISANPYDQPTEIHHQASSKLTHGATHSRWCRFCNKLLLNIVKY